MNIPINKDFEREYKDNAWQGYSLAETKYVVLGFGTALLSGVAFIFWLKISYQMGIYMAAFTMVPFIAVGFWRSKNGLTLRKYYQAIRYRKKTSTLLYQAREYVWQEPKEELPFRRLTRAEERKRKRSHAKYAARMRKGRLKEKNVLK